MLNAYVFNDGLLESSGASNGTKDIVWVDVCKPDEEEQERLFQEFEQPAIGVEALGEIEATSRFYKDEHGIHIHSYFIDDPLLSFQPDETMPRNLSASLTLHNNRLYTTRDEELAVFRLFCIRAGKASSQSHNGVSVLLGLFETKVDLVADLLERIYGELDGASRSVFGGKGREMQGVVSSLSRFEDLNGKLRLVILDTQRAMRFLLRFANLNETEQQRVRNILRDVESLTPHTNYLFKKVSFLMDAANGIINVDQNNIIKVMTLASVVFLPPTLIASLYGMNFSQMPELSWQFGYPMAVGVMMLSAVAPFLWFKRKGWL